MTSGDSVSDSAFSTNILHANKSMRRGDARAPTHSTHRLSHAHSRTLYPLYTHSSLTLSSYNNYMHMTHITAHAPIALSMVAWSPPSPVTP